jgi:hypothetical protein
MTNWSLTTVATAKKEGELTVQFQGMKEEITL